MNLLSSATKTARSGMSKEDDPKSEDGDIVKKLHMRMKKSSIPLSTGHKLATKKTNTRKTKDGSELQTIIDAFT